jgi:hypothetical protein
MLTETYEHLADAGYMKDDEKVDRAAIAQAVIATLTANVVQNNDLGEVQAKAMTPAELRSAILGQPANEDVEAELDALITNLTSIGSKGRVQNALENGYVLLSAPVTRTIVNGDTQSTMKRNGRFLTEDPDLIEQFFLQKQVDRIEGGVQEAKRRNELAVRRQPALGARLQPMIQKLHTYVALELPAGS